jgi:exodeoxyribonuclease III
MKRIILLSMMVMLTIASFGRKHIEKATVVADTIFYAENMSNRKNAGFTDEEREKMTELLNDGFTDTFRYKYPEQVTYSWWSYRFKAREKNAGWRIDYFLVSDRLQTNIADAKIHF